MALPTQIIVNNWTNPLGNGIVFVFNERLPEKIESSFYDSSLHPKTPFPGGRVSRSRVAFSDENCEIIASYIKPHDLDSAARIILVKTLSRDAKENLYVREKESFGPVQKKGASSVREDCLFSGQDIAALDSAMQSLKIELSGSFESALTKALIISRKTNASLTLSAEHGRKDKIKTEAIGAFACI